MNNEQLYFSDDFVIQDNSAKIWIYAVHGHYKREINRSMMKILSMYDTQTNIGTNVSRISIALSIEQTLLEEIVKSLIGIFFTRTESKNKCYLHQNRPPNPKLERVFIEVTNKCNLMCQHCYMGNPNYATLSLNNFKKIIDNFSDTGIYRIDLTGGEPFTDSEILEKIAYCHEKGYLVRIFTNGVLISDDIAENLSEMGVQHVFVSLDSSNPKFHDSFRGKVGSFNDTIAAIKRLTRCGIPVTINSMLTPDNKDGVIELVTLAKNLGVSIRMSPLLPVGRAYGKDVVSNSVISNSFKLIDDGKIIHSPCNNPCPSCGVGHTMIYVHSNGDAVLCPTLSKEQKPNFYMGNVISGDVADVLERFHFISHTTHISCKYSECKHIKYCNGGCRSRAFIMTGDISEKDEVSCYLYDALSNIDS